MPDLNRILSATIPLTLASVARGAQPLVLADLARAAASRPQAGRTVFIAADDAAMRAIHESAAFFAPELEVVEYPAWDCLPFDRASPAMSVSARRLAALQQLQQPIGSPQLFVTTINAALQRTLTPFRVRESTRVIKVGMEINRESLIGLVQRQGYSRVDTVVDSGEYAVRGSVFDLYPSGLGYGLRLDFFGDEIETMRLFDPGTQRSVQPVQSHLLLPASEALLDEDSIKRFRTRYREQFGAHATSDPLYQAVTDGRRLAGMEHWLPLLEDRLVTLFDHLAEGDLVLHMEHGIGRYIGLSAIAVGDSPHDCVQLEYHGGDKLYIPVENLDVLSRFGSDADGVQLDRLGGEAWQRRKAKMRERILEIAGQLMQTAALRALREADVLPVDPMSFGPFVDRFPWQETDDQERAIDEVLGDLASGKPMDRLVCGDVGFGKTEVALRAAFVAAMAGKQVAVIAPTTLLARQHYTNFAERFAGFPLNVGRLSRLVPAKEATATKEGLAAGTMDIVIGTHALLSKSLEFKRLGLVIVDEEQRFGVVHKEKLKELKADVHVLTLTATPIPRTLQMAMSGLRELSTIQTPPVDRLAVRTYVMPWDDVTMREALMREHQRGGQSFIVVPRIADMPDLEEWLRLNVPEIRAVSAHGQMSPTEVEDRMGAFYEKRYEVLLSTTIVESGLDIPSANTIVLHRADRFGLAQLYQLRGRVGRGKLRAYAYLTYPENQALSVVAEKRLKVLSDLDSLGAGFQLASHDLDIRGAGNLLGDEQSGHVREVGFELYQSMLEDAILAAKAGELGLAKAREALSPQITVDAPIMIPEDYVPDLAVRMALYRRMNDAEGADAVEALAAEMIDRFGPLPGPTQNLLKLIEIKRQAIAAHIAKIDVGAKGTLVSFHNDSFPEPAGLFAYIDRLAGTAKLRPDNKLVINRAWGSAEARLNGLVQLTKGLSAIARRGEKRAA